MKNGERGRLRQEDGERARERGRRTKEGEEGRERGRKKEEGSGTNGSGGRREGVARGRSGPRREWSGR